MEKNLTVKQPLNDLVSHDVNKFSVYFSLIMRTLLFLVFGFAIIGYFMLSGDDSPLKSAEKWWPFQALFANIITYFILKSFARKEGISYISLFHFEKGKGKKYAWETLWLVFVGLGFGGISLYIFAFILFGSFIPPDLMFQELPVWALIIAIILFPLSNGLVETTTYIGYALPRLQAITGRKWLAILFAGSALALQHIALPVVMDGNYMLWRFLSFVPLALVLGYIFTKTKRLVPIAIAHFLMDLQLIIQLVMMTNLD